MEAKTDLVIRIWRLLGGRKFMAWATSSVFFAYGKVSEETWKWITAFYIGANVAQKVGVSIGDIVNTIASKFTSKKEESSDDIAVST